MCENLCTRLAVCVCVSGRQYTMDAKALVARQPNVSHPKTLKATFATKASKQKTKSTKRVNGCGLNRRHCILHGCLYVVYNLIPVLPVVDPFLMLMTKSENWK